jgi:hypothetical protein
MLLLLQERKRELWWQHRQLKRNKTMHIPGAYTFQFSFVKFRVKNSSTLQHYNMPLFVCFAPICFTKASDLRQGVGDSSLSNNDVTNPYSLRTYIYCKLLCKRKSKAIPVTGSGGLYGCEMIRMPHCLDNRFTDGGDCQIYAPNALYLHRSSGTRSY